MRDDWCDWSDWCNWVKGINLEGTTMQEARKDDQFKTRLDLIPPEVILELGKVLTFGATKYDANNWQKLPDFEDRYYAAALRHLMAWRLGQNFDEESKLLHLSHALCCVAFLIWKVFHPEGKN